MLNFKTPFIACNYVAFLYCKVPLIDQATQTMKMESMQHSQNKMFCLVRDARDLEFYPAI